MKKCSGCGADKALEEFPFRKEGRLKRKSQCRGCAKVWRAKHSDKVKQQGRDSGLRWRYGIGLEEYAVLLEKQGGDCAICEDVPPQRALDVDHCHKTAKIRGLLCASCNTTLGRMKDDPALLRAAATYLEKHQ